MGRELGQGGSRAGGMSMRFMASVLLLMALHASADSVKCTKLAAHVSDICGEAKNIPGSRLCDIARQAQRAHCEVKDSAKGVLQGEKGGDELGEGLNKGTKSSMKKSHQEGTGATKLQADVATLKHEVSSDER